MTLEAKRAQLARLKAEVADLERQERRETGYPAARALVDTCWKYRNCYSCPQSEADYWWLYERVLSVSPDGTMSAHRVQIDRDGRLEVEADRATSWEQRMGWTRCDEAEYAAVVTQARALVGLL